LQLRTIRLFAVDCCECVLKPLRRLPCDKAISEGQSRAGMVDPPAGEIDLIVIGLSRFPMRRLFISQLRQIYSQTPMLILRRGPTPANQEGIIAKAEFLLSGDCDDNDLDLVRIIRPAISKMRCICANAPSVYQIIQQAVKIICEEFSNPELSLANVAGRLEIPTHRLGRILSRDCGVGFRQMLRQIRIQQAKSLLLSREYSIKEVSYKVGFTSTHYFARSFKQLTGVTASEYQDNSDAAIF